MLGLEWDKRSAALTTTTHSVTPSFTKAILAQAELLGLKVPPLLKRAIGSISNEQRLPMALQDALWLEIEAQDHAGVMGLEIGAKLQPGHFDTLGYLVLSSPDLSAAVDALVNFSALVGEGGRFNKVSEGEGIGLYYEPTFSAAKDMRLDTILLCLLNGTRWLAGQSLLPLSVHFQRAAPAQPDVYRQAFGISDIRFEQPRNMLLFKRSDWQKIVNPANPAFRANMLALAQRQLKSLNPQDFMARAEQFLEQDPVLTREQLAKRMWISERQLNRRLAECGHSFKTLSDQVKKAHAMQLIKQGPISQAALAFCLGYADESAFAKAFKRWMGMGLRAYLRHAIKEAD